MTRPILLIPLFIIGMNLVATYGKRRPSIAGPYTVVAKQTNNESTEYTSTGKAWVRLYYSPPKPKQLQSTWGYSRFGVTFDDTIQFSEIRTIPNHTVDFNFPGFPVMPYSRYLCTVALTKAGEVFGVFVTDVNIIPKQ